MTDATPGVVGVLGGSPGLSVSVLEVIRSGSASGNILSLTRTSTSILPSDITGQIHLALAFDDALNTLQPLYSLDGGSTVQSALAPQPWGFGGGGFSLSASSTVVPEPGTALLLGLGLAGLSRARRRRG